MHRFPLRRAATAAAAVGLLAGLPSAQVLFRTIDGIWNNPFFPELGSAGTELLRTADADYADGISAPAGVGLASPRAISNAVVSQPGPLPMASDRTDFLWQWGQFIDHDMDLTETATPAEPFPIPVPAGDAWFDPLGTGTAVIELFRSAYESGPGPRQQVNVLTAFLDASMVYGSDKVLAKSLRKLDGSGKLKTSPGDLLPFDPADPGFFLAGDVRVNEQVGLTAMHTLFVREHNKRCDELNAKWPFLDGETVYQLARAIVGGEVQKVTYEEFLPALLGPNALTPYAGYHPFVNPGIANEFSTAAYRFGHSLLSPQLMRLDASMAEMPGGHLPLQNAFFHPELVVQDGIEPFLRGLATQRPQEFDPHIVDDVRNFLFGPPGAGGFDLASLNMQRGREHGLPRYNDLRVAYGLAPHASFADVSSSADVQARLAAVYATVDDVDAWVGGLSEDHVPGAVVGELVFAVLTDQFERLRDGDRFYYEISLGGFVADVIADETLATIIRRCTSIDTEMQDDAFAPPPQP
jgi:hypothetical protein